MTLSEVLASYPVSIIEKLAHPRKGIASRTSWLPAVADVVKMADGLVEENRKWAELRAAAPRRQVLLLPRQPFRPFPQLWNALAKDLGNHEAADKRLLGINFEALCEANKRLVTRGKEEAMKYLDGLMPEARTYGSAKAT